MLLLIRLAYIIVCLQYSFLVKCYCSRDFVSLLCITVAIARWLNVWHRNQFRLLVSMWLSCSAAVLSMKIKATVPLPNHYSSD